MTPSPAAATATVAGAAQADSPGETPYPDRRKVWECAAVVTGVGLVVLVLPFGTFGYVALCATVSAATVAYAGYGLWRVPGTPRRWGLIGNPRHAEGIARGFGWAALMIAVGIVPVALGRELLERPPLASHSLYFLWCAVQDFVFFSLFLRNLIGHLPKWAAVLLTAVLFALSHYPFTDMMLMTGGAALVWGYIFATSRVLWFVFLPHLLLGYVLLT